MNNASIDMIKDIIGKEPVKSKQANEQNLWQIIVKDVFVVSLAVYIILSWFEWRSHGSVSEYFDFLWILIIVSMCSSIFLSHCSPKIRRHARTVIAFFNKHIKTIILPLFLLLVVITIAIEYFMPTREIFWGYQIIIIYITAVLLGLIVLGNKFKNAEKTCRLGNKRITLILTLIIVLGFFLRIYRLDFLDPAGDEYRHLIAMKRYFQEGFFEYNQSRIATYLLITIKKVFSVNSIFWFRIPFVLIGTLSIWLFYLLGKNLFNKTIGLTAAYLFAFMPLSIGLSRYIRGYSVELLLFLVALCILHSKRIRSSLLKIFISIIFLKASIIIDHGARMSGFFNIFLAYIASFILLDTLDKLKQKITVKLSALLFLFILGIIILLKTTSYSFFSKIEPQYLFLFNNTYSNTTWFWQFFPSIFLFIIFLLPLFFRKKRKNIMFSLYFTNIFIFFSFLFILDLPRSFQERYIYNILPFFLILFSAGIYYMSKIICEFLSFKKYYLLLFLLLLVITPPFKAFFFTINEKQGEFDKKTNLVFYDTKKLFEFTNKHQIKANEIITTSPWIFDYHFDQPFLQPTEKNNYVKFPISQSYEFKDRTKIFSVAGCRSETSIKDTVEIIQKNQDVKYIIAHVPLQTERPKFQPGFIPSKISNLTLVKIINTDKTFGFYVYEIIR